MKVILADDVENLGHKGDVVTVADGYARNYLVPKGLALMATKGALRQAEQMQRARERAAAEDQGRGRRPRRQAGGIARLHLGSSRRRAAACSVR